MNKRKKGKKFMEILGGILKVDVKIELLFSRNFLLTD